MKIPENILSFLCLNKGKPIEPLKFSRMYYLYAKVKYVYKKPHILLIKL